MQNVLFVVQFMSFPLTNSICIKVQLETTIPIHRMNSSKPVPAWERVERRFQDLRRLHREERRLTRCIAVTLGWSVGSKTCDDCTGKDLSVGSLGA